MLFMIRMGLSVLLRWCLALASTPLPILIPVRVASPSCAAIRPPARSVSFSAPAMTADRLLRALSPPAGSRPAEIDRAQRDRRLFGASVRGIARARRISVEPAVLSRDRRGTAADRRYG